MIQFVTVNKNYPGNISVLNDLSFEIQEGEFVFLVGPSGSGKTTIIKLLIREEQPSTGKIYFDDADITKFNRGQVYHLRRKIGVIFQDFKLINELTAFENIAFAMEAAGKPDSEIKENVPYLLDIVGLTSRMKAFPYQLSGGEKQRVAIARAMANNPKLLIADEPTGNLDPETAWDIAQILYKINNWGTTVLMSTHGSDIVNSMHKRVIRLDAGQILRDDFKGSYEDVDEFSLKIINSNEKNDSRKLTATAAAKTKPVTKTEPEPLKVVPPVKLTQTGRKISFSTKKTKLKPAGEVKTQADKTSIADLEISDSLKQYLQEKGYQNLEDIIEKGVEHLRNIDKLTDIQITEISKIIKNFMEPK
jgi:cell division transport system ATP-binding protein